MSEVQASLPRIATPAKIFVPVPANVAVKPIGAVRRGENLLADAQFVALSPVDGEIIGVESCELTSAKTSKTVAIRTAPSQAQGLSPGRIEEPSIENVVSAGIQADRRTSPDLLAQLKASRENRIDTILCNLLGEAPARLNAALAADFSQEIIAALQALQKLTNATRVWIAADAAFDRTVRPLRRAVRRESIRYIPMLNSYPLSDPTLLLYMLLGRRLNPSQLPPARGVILLDAAAALAIGQLILHGQPMLDVPIVIRDGFRGQWHVVAAPIGARVRDVCEQLNIRTDDVTIRAGDVLRDVQISADAVIASAEISLDVSPHAPAVNPNPCIRCGWCVQACPARIHPAGLLDAAQLHDAVLADRFGINSCIECGICSYVCPSHLPLLPSIRTMRAAVT